MGRAALDYAPCNYNGSKIWFRGPKVDLDRDYVAFLGGTETFGKFLPYPFATLSGASLQWDPLNLGVVNAGVDMYLGDAKLIEVARKAKATVIQVMSAANLSNKYYVVHPRRNDRFVRVTEHFHALAPKLDLTNVHFTRHFLEAVAQHDQALFELVRSELRQVWVYRMEQLMSQVGGRIVLIWFSPRTPDAQMHSGRLEKDPVFVDAGLIEPLRSMASEVLIIRPSEAARKEGVRGMVFHPPEADAASKLLGVRCHQEAAEQVRQSLIPLTLL